MIQTKQIDIVPHNPDWPHLFKIEAITIQEALQDNCIEIHHIGSTSIPGLIAKPKIDMIVVVKNPENIEEKLEKIGFKYRGEYNIPLHYGFSKRGSVNINLHVYAQGHPEIELNLLFRDYLRTHNDARNQYALLKKQILSDSSSQQKDESGFTNYTLRKGDFIREMLRQAGWMRLRILKCNDTTEWTAAKHFRQTYFFGPHGIEDPYTWTFNHKDHQHLILYQGIEIIGYAHIQLWPEHRCAIRIIVVDEKKRNNTFGSQFLQFIEQWLKNLGYKSIHAESRPTALAFYRKNSYVEMPFNDPEGHESHPNDTAVGKLL